MEIPRHWRLKDIRYRLEGQTCPICGANIFPPKAVCPHCAENGIRTFLNSQSESIPVSISQKQSSNIEH